MVNEDAILEFESLSNHTFIRIGGTEVSTKHASFIINVGRATFTYYLELVRHI
ncbi:hypothetical protein [Bacillus pseudomycoides]|uniref:hypothetical protein n=1 Tax=Bacillus pseudomycoides TaxID=64104 RepID=UPI0020FFF798|nr:hypothetical protein [Bacillus pseudomycoides]